MSEIEVGEYIRTTSGEIGKYIIQNKLNFLKTNELMLGFDIEKDIKAHSKNIIDLIEDGDIVCIKDIMYDSEYKSEVFENFENILCINNSEGDEIIELNENIENKQIKLLSILTHEIYEREAYKIE